MKKLIVLFMFIMFLVLPLSANAGTGKCERYWNELVEQQFMVVIDDVEFMLYFSDSVYGPCPNGNVTLSWKKSIIIDGSEYYTFEVMYFVYTTTPEFVTIEGLTFILTNDGKLILLPENPLIFDLVEE